jgi:hypothetical protein
MAATSSDLAALMAEIKKQSTPIAGESKEAKTATSAGPPIGPSTKDTAELCLELEVALKKATAYFRAPLKPDADAKDAPLYTDVLAMRRYRLREDVPVIRTWYDNDGIRACPELKYRTKDEVLDAINKSPLGGFAFLENKLVLAGGALSSLITGADVNDYDIFSLHETKEGLKDAVDKLGAHLRSKVGALRVVGTHHCVTFINKDCKVQVILRKYDNVAHVLYDFDLGSSAVGLYANELWFSAAALVSYTYQCNVLNLAARSFSYEHRLVKYVKRGFSIVLPNLTASYAKVKSLWLGEDRLHLTEGKLRTRGYGAPGSNGPMLVDYDNISQIPETNLKHLANGRLDRGRTTAVSDYAPGMDIEKLPVPVADIGTLLSECIQSGTHYNMTKLRTIFGPRVASMLLDQAHNLGLSTEWPLKVHKIAEGMRSAMPPTPAFTVEYERVGMLPRDTITLEKWYGEHFVAPASG